MTEAYTPTEDDLLRGWVSSSLSNPNRIEGAKEVKRAIARIKDGAYADGRRAGYLNAQETLGTIARIRAEAWDEGWDACESNPCIGPDDTLGTCARCTTPNPYREDKTDDQCPHGGGTSRSEATVAELRNR